jgi:hypothetical protein
MSGSIAAMKLLTKYIRRQGRRNKGGQGPPSFQKTQKVPSLRWRKLKIVQANVAVNTILTSKVPFLFPEHIYMCPFTQASYVVNTNLRHVSKSNEKHL